MLNKCCISTLGKMNYEISVHNYNIIKEAFSTSIPHHDNEDSFKTKLNPMHAVRTKSYILRCVVLEKILCKLQFLVKNTYMTTLSF